MITQQHGQLVLANHATKYAKQSDKSENGAKAVQMGHTMSIYSLPFSDLLARGHAYLSRYEFK
eukprot:2989506-Amphidinium_carterae.1